MVDMPISKSLVYPRTHWFHIPVMGTGHSIDTPLRVARWGISSVISLVDDVLIEQVHKLHRERRGQPFAAVSPSDPDARSKRIQAYLDFLHDEIEAQMAELRAQEFAPGTDKSRYFEMLPASSPLRRDYERLLALPQGAERDSLAADLTARMEAGSIDANIMTKLDRQTLERDGTPRPPQYSDAKTALRGFATSKVAGNLVLSAGINPTLYGCLEEFQDFYRQDGAEPRKGIVVKVSDYRSALTQGRFLAKKGIEVREFRIESGLNCGGHAFASEGDLMGPILEEFRANRGAFRDEFAKLIQSWYAKKGLPLPASAIEHEAAVTAQGGLGTYGENRRLLETFGLDAVGWASPFLLVPESTPIDAYTRQLLARATSADLYTSDASPLGVPFNNVRGSSAEIELKRRVELGKPGSPCPKGFISLNTEFEGKPICTASADYQARKLETVGGLASPAATAITVKECICHQLGNGALEFIRAETRELRGEAEPKSAARLPVSVCPGPNIAWFNRTYALSEMIDHIYGRIPSLVPAHRPHAFATEIQLYVEHFQKLVAKSDLANAKEFEKIRNYRVNFSASLVWNRTFAANRPFDDENLPSLLEAVESAESVIAELWDEVSERAEKPLVREAQ